jgi:16S rRNA (cytosine1402-N4)-methyltransferase
VPVYHQPVMLQEVRELLQPQPRDVIVDCNLGTGGHSLALLQDCEEKGFLVGLDLDPNMLSLALKRFHSHGVPSHTFSLVHADHGNLAQVMGDLGLTIANRILMDLGASSLHFDSKERGFSCTADGPLDMRYDQSPGNEGLTAAEIINTWSVDDLSRLFKAKGDERWARAIARRIVKRREERPFQTTADLAYEIGGTIPRKAWPPKIHPATRVFLALRVEVNNEDHSLTQGLQAALDLLAPGGRLVVLTFQSHEDRTVKKFFRRVCRDVIDEHDPWGTVLEAAQCRDLTRRPLRPSAEEEEANPRSRSTKLRAVEKLEAASQ